MSSISKKKFDDDTCSIFSAYLKKNISWKEGDSIIGQKKEIVPGEDPLIDGLVDQAVSKIENPEFWKVKNITVLNYEKGNSIGVSGTVNQLIIHLGKPYSFAVGKSNFKIGNGEVFLNKISNTKDNKLNIVIFNNV